MVNAFKYTLFFTGLAALILQAGSLSADSATAHSHKAVQAHVKFSVVIPEFLQLTISPVSSDLKSAHNNEGDFHGPLMQLDTVTRVMVEVTGLIFKNGTIYMATQPLESGNFALEGMQFRSRGSMITEKIDSAGLKDISYIICSP